MAAEKFEVAAFLNYRKLSGPSSLPIRVLSSCRNNTTTIKRMDVASWLAPIGNFLMCKLPGRTYEYVLEQAGVIGHVCRSCVRALFQSVWWLFENDSEDFFFVSIVSASV